jgi:hypothetical protein
MLTVIKIFDNFKHQSIVDHRHCHNNHLNLESQNLLTIKQSLFIETNRGKCYHGPSECGLMSINSQKL